MKIESVTNSEVNVNNLQQRETQNDVTKVDFEKITASSSFQEMMQRKKKFIFPLTIFFLVFYFTLPILTSYTTLLNRPVWGDITLAWVYATAQFVMTWALCIIYVKKSNRFDRDAQEVLEKEVRS